MISKKKNSLFVWGWDRNIIIFHHSASLVTVLMPNGDPQNGFFYPTLMMDSNYLSSKAIGKSFQDYSWTQDFEADSMELRILRLTSLESQPQNPEL